MLGFIYLSVSCVQYWTYMSMDCPFLISPSVFPNIFLLVDYFSRISYWTYKFRHLKLKITALSLIVRVIYDFFPRTDAKDHRLKRNTCIPLGILQKFGSLSEQFCPSIFGIWLPLNIIFKLFFFSLYERWLLWSLILLAEKLSTSFQEQLQCICQIN